MAASGPSGAAGASLGFVLDGPGFAPDGTGFALDGTAFALAGPGSALDGTAVAPADRHLADPAAFVDREENGPPGCPLHRPDRPRTNRKNVGWCAKTKMTKKKSSSRTFV